MSPEEKREVVEEEEEFLLRQAEEVLCLGPARCRLRPLSSFSLTPFCVFL